MESFPYLFSDRSRDGLREECPELHFLREWETEVESARPMSKLEQLREELRLAIERDQFERAADLRDRLISGLKIRTTSERKFIEQVLQRVESNEIPQKLVDSAFLWVRSNKANHDYPFFYFERVLRIRGKRAGVAIPPFTYPTKSLKND